MNRSRRRRRRSSTDVDDGAPLGPDLVEDDGLAQEDEPLVVVVQHGEDVDVVVVDPVEQDVLTFTLPDADSELTASARGRDRSPAPATSGRERGPAPRRRRPYP